MKEFINKLIERLEEEKEAYSDTTYYAYGVGSAIKIVNQLAEEYNNGWIPCEKELPPQPKRNPALQNKPLELYLVIERDVDYPCRVFWNGKYFTDGWSIVDAIAWQPLPAPYQQKGE